MLPSHIESLIAAYPEDHECLRHAALRGGEHFAQLLESHPLLALFVATHANTQEQLRDLLTCKRRDLLGLYGFPRRPWYARLLARVPRASLTLETARLFQEPDAFLWAGLQTLRLTPIAVSLLTDEVVRSSIRLRLLREIEATWTIEDAHDLQTLLHLVPAPRRHLRRTKDAYRFLSQMRRWIGTYTGSNRALAEHPIPGVDQPDVRITPITTEGQLLQESLLLQHCAFSMIDQAIKGERWFYAVELPDTRATLCLEPIPGDIRIAYFAGLRNDVPDPCYWNWMFTWLHDATADFVDEPTYD